MNKKKRSGTSSFKRKVCALINNDFLQKASSYVKSFHIPKGELSYAYVYL